MTSFPSNNIISMDGAGNILPMTSLDLQANISKITSHKENTKQYVQKCDGDWSSWSACENGSQSRNFIVKRVGSIDYPCPYGSGERQTRTC